MKCPTCEAAGERSRVDIGGTIATAMAGYSYYDEDGRSHSHDPNSYTTSYSCSRGHTWRVTEGRRCWCESAPAKELGVSE